MNLANFGVANEATTSDKPVVLIIGDTSLAMICCEGGVTPHLVNRTTFQKQCKSCGKVTTFKDVSDERREKVLHTRS